MLYVCPCGYEFQIIESWRMDSVTCPNCLLTHKLPEPDYGESDRSNGS